MTQSHYMFAYARYLLTSQCIFTTGRTALPFSSPTDDIHGYDQRVDVEAVPLVHTYGTYGLGMDLTAAAWPGLLQVFTGGDSKIYDYVGRPECTVIDDIRRISKGYLIAHPIDMLILGNMDADQERDWFSRLPSRESLAPSLIIEYWEPWHIMTASGPMAKGIVTRWEEKGYASSCITANATCAGGVVDRAWLIVARWKRSVREGWIWPELPTEVERPMVNCLRPVGVPWAAYRQVPTGSTDDIPSARLNCMPAQPGAFINTDRGVRRLLHDELATGLGLPKAWRKEYPPGHLVRKTVALHLFEYLTPLLLLPRTPAALPGLPEVAPADDVSPISACKAGGDYVIFEWHPPDIRPGSDWNAKRLRNLRTACDTYPDSDRLYEEGVQMLDRHRNNYDEEGPNLTQVQLLWWEFPSEHWDALREGSPMNFLRDPVHIVQPNSAMTEEQLVIAVQFFDELVDLGIFKELLEDEIMLTNAPLFCLPKAGQPGQWRILADMRKGRQNEAIGADPTIFPKASVILDQMYCGGWSAVVDASKFFHQFTVRKEDQKFLGILHPRTGRVYVYGSLPMGSASSPSLANRYGSSVLRRLRDTSPLFQGRPYCNTWWQAFAGGPSFNPKLDHGMVLIGDDGLPAALIWAHCDDFLIHGPTHAKCSAALTAFMDYVVEVGLLCHPGKLTPPSQVAKYTGFLFDTRGIPTLRVPEYKVDKSVAMIDYAIARRDHFSRLGLAVVKGVLESQSEATPLRSGHTHLRSL